MKLFQKDKKLKKRIRKLGEINQLKHNEMLNVCPLPHKNDSLLFKNFDINEMILKALNAMQFSHATDIQARILPDALKFKDLIASEKTGSGKTLAYLIPLLNLVLKFRFKPFHGTCAVVIVPTKELCIQVCSVFSQLSKFCNVKFNMIHGDETNKENEKMLALGCTVLFCTPTSLLQHMKHSLKKKEETNIEYFRYHNLKFLVIDEADRFLDKSYKKTVSEIIQYLPSVRQTMILSATLNLDPRSIKRIKKFAKKFLSSSFVSINISEKSDNENNKTNATVDNLTEGYVVLPATKRIFFLISLIQEIKNQKVLIFFSSSIEVEFYFTLLNLLNVNNQSLLMLHSNLTTDTRSSNLINFNKLKSGFLLCTDVIARGIDIPEVSLVVQYDIPADCTSYIHRVGRTARNGMQGTSILLLRPDESENIIKHLSKVSMSLIEFETPHLNEIENHYLEQFELNSQLSPIAKNAFINQLESYQTSEFVDSLDHIKVEDEIVNFCLKEIPSLPKTLKINSK